MEAFAKELQALIAVHGRWLNDNQIITTLERALSRAWGDACEPQPASLFAAAPKMLEALKSAEPVLSALADEANAAIGEAAQEGGRATAAQLYQAAQAAGLATSVLSAIAKAEGR